MSSSAAPQSPQLDLSPELAEEVHRVLSQKTRDIRLTGALRDLYRRATWHRRSNQVRAWAHWVIALNIMMMFCYQLIIPQAVWAGILIPSLVLVPSCLVLLRVWRKPRSAAAEGFWTTLLICAQTAAIVVLGGIAGGYDQERFATAAVFIVGTCTILFAVDFLWTMALAGITILIFIVSHLFNPLMPTATVFTVGIFYAAGMATLIVSRKTMNIVAMHAFLLSLRDRVNIKAMADANVQLQLLATLDPLTGIANRRVVTDHMARLFADRDARERPVVVMIDIDHFKGLNDTRGHAEGDIALKQVADALRTAIRPEMDMVARYGGEEFIVVLTQAPRAFAISLAEGIRRKIEALAIANPGAPDKDCITVSIGVAFPDPQETAEETVRRADAALYQAKAGGRNRVVIDLPELQTTDAVAESTSNVALGQTAAAAG